MSIGTGTSIGSYQIIGHLGSGGMGVVYRAYDTKLKRDVAIKCLPQALASEPDRVARFQREAEVLASLNHPHIGAIYDLLEIADQRFIVLELVEGETLAARLMHGRIPLTEVVEIARQIVDALEAAHDKGIVHRDLKPSNIHVRPDGHVKVLDFGLAKILEQVSTTQDVADSPTMTGTGTVVGRALLGTAAYMSPEQARGQEATRSADIWAFGCVLFEMIAGRPTFGGETATDILGSVVKLEPDWAMLPRDTPPNIRRLLTRCLQKDRKRRLHHIADARLDLDEMVVADPPVRRRSLVPWAVAAVAIALAAAGGVALYLRGGAPVALEQRVEINTPPARRPALQSFALSPDGTKLAFVVAGDSQPQLWWRSLDSVTARPLPGTQGAQQPFWSPDNQSIGFFAESALKSVDLASGVVRRLGDAPVGGGNGGTWNADGVILFNRGPGWPLHRISSSGQDRRDATRLDPPRQGNHSQPHFLPDGRHFLYYANGSPDGRGVYVGTLDSFESTRLFDADGPPTFMPPDRLFAPQGGTTYVRRFDPRTLTISTNPIPFAQGAFRVSASATGILAYRTPPATQSRAPDLLWAERSGKTGDPIVSGNALSPALSPDGTRVAFFRGVDGNFDIWVADVASRRVTRFTSAPEVERSPTWSPDGKRIVFTSKLGRELHWKLASGVGAESTVMTANVVVAASDWSSNGFLLYQKGPVFKRDIYAQRLSSDVKPEGDPIAIAASPEFDERDAKFSQDGRWIAYQSNETGRFEIYAAPFPSLDSKIPITSTGGLQVRWRKDDQELIYLSLDGAMMSVPITASPDGKTLKVGTPVRLFQTNILALEPSVDINGHSYEMSSRADRFLMMEGGEGAINSPITLILNWKPPFP